MLYDKTITHKRFPTKCPGRNPLVVSKLYSLHVDPLPSAIQMSTWVDSSCCDVEASIKHFEQF